IEHRGVRVTRRNILMDRISEHVSQWAAGSNVSDCAVAGPLPALGDATPTLVIAQSTESCDSDARNFKGIVFFNHQPVAWCCLRSEEIPSFKAWGSTALPGAQIVAVPQPLSQINCPPPNPSMTANPPDLSMTATPRDALRIALRTVAAVWLARAA